MGSAISFFRLLKTRQAARGVSEDEENDKRGRISAKKEREEKKYI